MSDIVERLRSHYAYNLATRQRGQQPELDPDCKEAANEIERLRHDLANAQMRAAIDTTDKAHRRYIENDY